MIMCPNFKNPDVAREFNEIKEATSEKAAYRIWSLNNGNAIDKAPNGAESKLFLDLFNHFKQFGFEDSYARKITILAKAKLYSSEFFNWFGDWTGNYENSVDSSEVTKTIQDNGKIRLSLNSHTDEHPRQIVIEPQGNNKFYVHVRIWDGEKIPGKITDLEKRLLFNALYKELPVGAEILLPKSGEGYYATRGTIAAMMRLSRDIRFKTGSSGTVLYEDEGEIKEYSGTSFIKIGYNSVSKVVDENGEPLMVFHGGSKRIRTSGKFIVPHEQTEEIYDVDEDGEPIYGPGQEYNYGVFFTTDKEYAKLYMWGKNDKLYIYPTFLNIKNPLYDENMSSRSAANAFNDNWINEVNGEKPWDGIIGHDAKTMPVLSNGTEFAVFNADQIKSIYNDGSFSSGDKIYYNLQQDYNGPNPYKIPKNKKRVVLSEQTSEKLNNYLQKSRGVYPKLFYDDVNKVTYVKSNKNKKSRLYDVVNPVTGEVIAQKQLLFTKEQWDALQEVRKQLDEQFTHYNQNRSFAFKKGISTPSKSLFKRMAKQYLLEAIKASADVSDNVINHEIIDLFVDQFNDSVWEHIITYALNPTYGLNRNDEPFLSKLFGLATTLFSIVFNRFAFNRTIPKQGLIDEVSKKLNIKAKDLYFTGYAKGEYYKKQKIDRNLPYDVLEEMLFLIAENTDTRSDDQLIQEYAQYRNIPVDLLKLYILYLREQGTVEASKEIQYILHSSNIVKQIQRDYSEKYKEWLNQKGITIPSNIVNIVFNRDSFAGDDTPIVRLATIMHEPFHALEMLHNGSNAHKSVLNAFDAFIQTEYGKEVFEDYKKHNKGTYSEEDIPSEFLADLFSLIMMPQPLRKQYSGLDDLFLGSRLAKTVQEILDRPDFDTLIHAEPKAVVEQITELLKIVLPLIKRIYNAIVKWLSEYSDFVKNTFKLYDEIKTVVSYRRNDTFYTTSYLQKNESAEEFRNALDLLSDAMKNLQKLDVLEGVEFPASTLFLQGVGQKLKKPYTSPTMEIKSIAPQSDILSSSAGTTSTMLDEEWEEAIDSEIESSQEIKELLHEECEVWVNELIDEWRSTRPIIIGGPAIVDEEEQKRLDLTKEFYRNKVRDSLYNIHDKLRTALPITSNSTGLMREKFLDQLKETMADPKKARFLLQIAYNEMLGVKVEHNVRPVIHAYIETFHQSDLIQEALKVLDNGRGLSTPKLIRDLCDAIEGNIVTGHKKKVWSEFWHKFMSDFNRMMRKVFRTEKGGLTYKERRNILNDVTQWFLSNEELRIEENAQCVYDMSKWTVNGKELQTLEKDVIDAIKRGVYSRLKGIRSTTSNDASETEIDFLESWKDALEAIEGRVDLAITSQIDSGYLDPDDTKAIAEARREIRKEIQQDEISRFLINGLDELRRLSVELQNMRSNDIQFSNFAKLMRMKADIMGFYEIVSSRYVQSYTRFTDNPEFKEGGSIYGQIKAIRNAVNSIKTVYDAQLERYADYIVDRIAEDYIDIGDKKLWANNAKLWLRNKIDGGNLAFLETVAGPAYASTSPIVRILDLYVREANTAVRQDVQKRGKKLISLYDKCEPTLRKLYPGNFMRYFCELDEDGKPTGYFVSKYKIGTFEKKREEVRQRLLSKYNAEIDPDTGVPTFETEEDRIAYLDEYDRARYDLGEVRRYTPDYYIVKRHTLSRDTDALLSQYDGQIQRLKKGGIEIIEVDGKKIEVFLPNKLTPSARYDLERLQREKEALGNPYEIVYDSAGNISSIKEKQGVAAERARQIMAWNRWRAENVERNPNTVKFNSVRQQLVDKYGEDSIEVKRFDWDYTTRRATQDWYDTLMSFVGYTNDLYEELREKRKALLKAIEYKSGLYINRYNFDKLNGEALEIFKQLDSEISLAKEDTDRDDEEMDAMMDFFNTRTKTLQFAKDGTNIPFLEYELNRILSLFPGDAVKMQELYYDRYFYEDKDGNLKPLSIFSQLSPSQPADIEENVPIGIFNEINEDSDFVDERFDPNEDSEFQIDKTQTEFINERHDEIMKDPKLKAFYEELLSVMDEAWDQLPNIYRTSKYQMPQRRDRSSHLITRLGSFKAIMSNLFKVNENDILFNEEVTTHADGTTIETIPVRWVKKLQDPKMVSTDILGSVVDFYEMALNFREKQAIAAMGEALKLQTSKTSTGEIETDQASRLGTYLSMFVYGRMVKGFKGTAMSETEKVIAKTLYRLRNLAHAKLMKHNWFAVAKNMIDSTSSLLGEIYGGKHFTISMFIRAIGHMGKEIFNGSAFSLGKTNTRSWTAKAMQFNGVSGSTYELFHHRNESRARRILQATPMIEYTFVDYSFKGVITNMVYDSYRLITNPTTGKQEFMNMELAQYVYSKAGKGRNVGFEMFENSKITLRLAYNTEGTSFELKDEYIDIVRPYNPDLGRRSRKLEQRVSSTIQERSGIINGMLNDIDRGKLNQNYVGALVMLMRGWMISQMSDNIKYGHDFARYSSDAKEFIDKSSMKKYLERVPLFGRTLTTEGLDLRDPQMAEEDEDYTGMFNLVTGTIDNGVWRNLLRAYIHWAKDLRMFKINRWFGKAMGNENITRQEVYQVRKMNASITAVMIISTLSFVLGKSLEGDGDDPQWWKLALYSYMVGSISELTTKLGYAGFMPTVMDLVNSFAIAPSTVFEDLDAPAEVGADVLSLSIAAINKFEGDYGKDALAPVKTGSYSKLPIGIRGNKKIEKAIGAKDGHTPQYLKNMLELSSVLPVINDLGIANIWKNLSISGLNTKADYYTGKLFPTKYVIYNALRSTLPKKQHGIFGMLENLDIIPEQQKRVKPSNKKISAPSGRGVRGGTRRSTR